MLYSPFGKGGLRGIRKMLPYNRSLKKNARQLRKNQTKAELLLWSRIRRKQLKGLQFLRQKVIGSYIVDFYCSKAKIVVELDGGQHYTDEGVRKDAERDGYLKTLGIRVIRVPDNDVMKNIDAVVEDIWNSLNPPVSPFFKGGEKISPSL